MSDSEQPSLVERNFRDQVERAAKDIERCVRILDDDFGISTRVVFDDTVTPVRVAVYFSESEN